MSEDFGAIEQSVLLDKLAEYTSRYMQFLTQGGVPQEASDCRQTIEELQNEIEKRRSRNNGSSGPETSEQRLFPRSDRDNFE